MFRGMRGRREEDWGRLCLVDICREAGLLIFRGVRLMEVLMEAGRISGRVMQSFLRYFFGNVVELGRILFEILVLVEVFFFDPM